MRLNHVARFIVNANHSIMRTAQKPGLADCFAHCIRLAIPQATEWQRIGNQIDTAFIFARADFVSVHHLNRRKLVFESQAHSSYWTLSPKPN
jgi:hypothetical protein